MSITHEKTLIASILNGADPANHPNLKPQHFYDERNGAIWETINQINAAGGHPDVPTLQTRLNGVIDPEYIAGLHDTTINPANTNYHVTKIQEEAGKRQLTNLAYEIHNSVDKGDGYEQVIDTIQKALRQPSPFGTTRFHTLADGLQDTLDELRRKPTYAETPWTDLNWLINGWAPGRLYVVGARPSVGKTVFGLQAALSLTNMGPVAYTSLEMSATELQKRAISHIARVDMKNIQRHELRSQDWAQIEQARQELENSNLHIDPSHDRSLHQIIRHAKALKNDKGLSALVVDYIGIIALLPGRNERETITEASKKLKQLAIELNIPVIVLSQLNRGVEGRDNKEPRNSDLRMSGSLEQDADVVILLHRDLRDHPEEIKMIVGKNRQGMTGDCMFDFAGHYSEIRDQHTF